MLGAIGDPKSRALLERILASRDAGAINDAVAGLSSAQCAAHLFELKAAADDPTVRPKNGILDAVARADTSAGAEVLRDVAERAEQPDSGIAFGFLERAGGSAEPLLAGIAVSGRTAWSRETALSILRRMNDRRSLPAFRSALNDAAVSVRLAGALGLAQFGYQDGIRELEAAAGDKSSEYQIEAVVALAGLGQSAAFDTLKKLLASREEAVRGQSVWAIARSGNTNLKQFAYNMGLDHQPVFRSMLAEKLLDPNDKRDKATLDEMITHSDELSRLIAAQRLLQTGTTAKSVVAEGLRSDNEAGRRLALKIALTSPSLRSTLAGSLGSADPAVEVAALSAMADLHETGLFRNVAADLESTVPRVSAEAARALVALDPVAARAVLEAGLGSQKGYVRINSAAMLLAITQARPGR